MEIFLKNKAVAKTFTSFDISADYLTYVDGKPRGDGIRSFLASRNIKLTDGANDDTKDVDSIAALRNVKKQLFFRPYITRHTTI